MSAKLRLLQLKREEKQTARELKRELQRLLATTQQELATLEAGAIPAFNRHLIANAATIPCLMGALQRSYQMGHIWAAEEGLDWDALEAADTPKNG